MSYTPKIASWPKEFGNKLPLTEAFYSIQGEGRWAGHPAVFLRFKYCNLGCAWCDTRFTWDQENIEPGEVLDPVEIASRAVKMLDGSHAIPKDVHIVLTGGEPMLHQDRIPKLIEALKFEEFEFFEIETNGMFAPNQEMLKRISWWNCSPKLTNNGLPSKTNIVPDALQAIVSTGKADFKFVIQAKRDLEQIERDFLPLIPRESIMLMPEGTCLERMLQTTPWLLEECKSRGYRFSPRLHILAWGNERGR